MNDKGYAVLGEFNCKGFDTNSFLKHIGGISKGHPDSEDIKDARQFAGDLLRKYEE